MNEHIVTKMNLTVAEKDAIIFINSSKIMTSQTVDRVQLNYKFALNFIIATIGLTGIFLAITGSAVKTGVDAAANNTTTSTITADIAALVNNFYFIFAVFLLIIKLSVDFYFDRGLINKRADSEMLKIGREAVIKWVELPGIIISLFQFDKTAHIKIMVQKLAELTMLENDIKRLENSLSADNIAAVKNQLEIAGDIDFINRKLQPVLENFRIMAPPVATASFNSSSSSFYDDPAENYKILIRLLNKKLKNYKNYQSSLKRILDTNMQISHSPLNVNDVAQDANVINNDEFHF